MLLPVLVPGAAVVRRDQVARLLAQLVRTETSHGPEGGCRERRPSPTSEGVHVERHDSGLKK